jgi:hypothetical protein
MWGPSVPKVPPGPRHADRCPEYTRRSNVEAYISHVLEVSKLETVQKVSRTADYLPTIGILISKYGT